jgi:hypothetical protein
MVISQLERMEEGKSREQNQIKNYSISKLSTRFEPTLWMNLTTLPSNDELKITKTHTTISNHSWISG